MEDADSSCAPAGRTVVSVIEIFLYSLFKKVFGTCSKLNIVSFMQRVSQFIHRVNSCPSSHMCFPDIFKGQVAEYFSTTLAPRIPGD